MIINDSSRITEVSGINEELRVRIRDFLKGAVYSWCKNRPGEWFSIRDLMGGENFNWDDTPLQILYQKHHDRGKSHQEAIKGAGQDSGRLLKRVIHDDNRRFETRNNQERIRQYRWVQE